MATAEQRREDLVALYHEVRACELCPLSATRTQAVFGAGNADADLMFVGEAPGAQEDADGIPFVGRAGKLLNELLAENGLSRDDVFIAEEAEVDAVVHATNVTIAGNMRGTVNCTARHEILPRGRVAGDINAPVLVVHEGAVLAGDVAMAAPADRKSSQAASPRERATRGSDRASS